MLDYIPMNKHVKTTVKAQRSRATRRKIIDAARRLFESDGYISTTIAEIASAAGVATQTVYFVFGNKLSILEAVLDVAITGDDEPVPVLERDWVENLKGARSAAEAASLIAREAGGIVVRAAPIYKTILHASAEPEIEALLAENKRRRGESIDAFVRILCERGLLEKDREQRCSDLLYAVNSEESYMLLVHERGWTDAQWIDWVERSIESELARSG